MKSFPAKKGRPAASHAGEILRRVFGDIEYGLHFRMWDGTVVAVGREVMPATVTFTSLASFKRVLLNPQADGFAEAYCDGALEFEGDLFEAMKVADSLDKVELTTTQKLLFALRIWNLSE